MRRGALSLRITLHGPGSGIFRSCWLTAPMKFVGSVVSWSGRALGFSWAESVCQVAVHRLDMANGSHSRVPGSLDGEWEEEGTSDAVLLQPCISTNGNMVHRGAVHVSVAGAGVHF